MKKILGKIKPMALNEKSRKIFFIIIGLLLLACIALGAVYLYKNADDSHERQMVEKINSLNNENVSCEQVVSEIGNESPDQYEPSTQILLLTQKLACYSELGDNDKALDAAEKLKNLYSAQGNDYQVRITEITIKNIKSSASAREGIEQYDTGQPVQ